VSDRGGEWVVAQFAVIALCFFAVLIPPDWPSRLRGALTVAGGLLAVGGMAVAVWASRVLGPALTPFPRPAADAALVAKGPYAVVRHPVYAGGILFFVGWSLYAGPAALAITGVLAILWARKCVVEERRLAEVYPDYGAYAARVPWRLVPGIY
jgi:protein-S-isoprenylcysteine O-methyltransferase Ste14